MYKFHIWKTILIFSIFYILINYITNEVIFNDLFYYNILSNKFSLKNIEEVIQFKDKYERVSFILLPLIIIIKYTFVSIIIFIGIKLFEVKINLRECFKIVLLAELIPLISSVTKTLYFYIYPPRSLEFIQKLNPLGITNFLKNDSIPKYLLYPLQQINLFEVGYWLLLAYGIKSLGNVDFKKALKITSLSYGVGLLIWCIVIVFLQLQFS